MTFLDWLRVYNGATAAVTAWFMVQVTWRLYPQMRWYEQFARQSITLAFLGFSYGSFESLATHAPYGFRMFIATAAFTGGVIAFATWAHHLPRRPIGKRNS